jgi:nitronate monooxygenase
MREFGIPFWIGGGLASPAGLKWALENGAAGIQVGSIFALSRDSGLRDDLRCELLRRIYRGEARTRTDLNLSPTGFPFKVVDLEGTIADRAVLAGRKRLCDQGLLLRPYVDDTGKIGFRCPAEPIDNYVRKGGKETDTVGAECLCNGLLSTTTKASAEAPSVITLGDDVSFVHELLKEETGTYGVEDVMQYLLQE